MATTKNTADSVSIGRPTVATDEMLVEARKYVEGAWVQHKLQSGHTRVMPTVEGLAIWLGISRDTVYANAAFSDIVKSLKEFQHEELSNGAATGLINPIIGKLFLSSKHGYVEKTATEADNRNVNLDVTELSDEDLDAKLAKLKSV